MADRDPEEPLLSVAAPAARQRGLLLPAAALLWGLQAAFLNPALALLLVALYGASGGQVGLVLAVYNASGFLASLVVPSWADRRRDYLRPLLGCGVLTLALTVVLGAVTALPLAVAGLVVLGGPASVGMSMLFAQLKHSGAQLSDVVRTRAVFSFAWVAGPPLATLVIGAFGSRSVLLVIGAVAVLNVATTLAMQRRARALGEVERPRDDAAAPVSKVGVGLVMLAFLALMATNSCSVSVMGLFVTRSLHLDVEWAGVALGVAAALEIPALLLLGRLGARFGSLPLVATGCVAGIAYYAAMAYASGPLTLVALQVLNAWFVAVVAGVGLALFQEVVPRPGLASGLYSNTRRLGAIASGPILALGSTSGGYARVFAVCAVLTALALAVVGVAARVARLAPRRP
ncbi:SET family sugar efflux transporter-like MFS transporter [Motilibacter rhizosphaerae]|uniref:SET family sugar efflux transporter-like MFS transporter n=1 Tax=Motilibacter rhizosphaerae TaxID=598652 RepID=A0A4Q7NWV4_9ACTN|nr:MFS transporter [Motilibacter rhizosphaerae]RZS90882.1 SET family sugar efflux transporter-like MFS transporter [Motilibacter rhizosphaerae]